jgi:membrane fusion protein, multidrug efflux system
MTSKTTLFPNLGDGICRPRVPKLMNRLLTALTLALILAGCNDKNPPKPEASPAEVSVATVLFMPIVQWAEFNGRVSAVDAVEVRPRVSGYVQRIAYKEGENVRQGDLLFVIDQRPYQAALDSARAQLDRARATTMLAKTQDQRSQTLFQAHAASKEESETRGATLVQSQADVRAAEAAVAAAKLNLEFTEVRAPVSGRAGRAMSTKGNLAVADQTLMTSVVSQDPVYVYFDPDEHSYLHYKSYARQKKHGAASAQVRIGLADEEGFPHLGTMDFIDNQVDPATGTIHARAILANKDYAFTPGLYAHVQLADGAETQSILIDDKAVLTDQDRKYVYVLGLGDQAQRRDVTLGNMANGLRVITAGLTAGDKIVVDGLQNIYSSGATVKPIIVSMDRTQKNAADFGAHKPAAK